MGRKVIDLTSKTVGRLTIVSQANQIKQRIYWRCHCSCGKETVVLGSNLVGSHPTLSCGCYRADYPRKKKHGKTGTPIYKCWHSMLERCRNSKDSRYKDYGARGILVCIRWDTFTNFYADMGDIPEGKSLGRIDNDGPYSPENCQWEYHQDQMSNTRRTIKITVGEKTQCLAAWARELGVNYATLSYRYKVGNWPAKSI